MCDLMLHRASVLLRMLVKMTSGLLPEQALAAASRRLQEAVHQCSIIASPAAASDLEADVVLRVGLLSAVLLAAILSPKLVWLLFDVPCMSRPSSQLLP